MFLTLSHQKLDVYVLSRVLLVECYKLTAQFPSEEKFGLTSQIRRAAISILLNTAEGSSRKTIPDRKRFYEIARSSATEIDGALDASNDLGYLINKDLTILGDALLRCFQMLSRMI